MIWLVDISNYQGNFNVAQAGREGLTYQDPRFDTFIPQIKAAGLIPGAYHFLRAGDGAAQARAFHARVASHGGPGGFLCACDNEKDATWDVTRAFYAEWNRLTGGHPLMMYSGDWWWNPRGWNGSSLTPYLWTSHYVSGTGTGSALYAKVPASWWTPGYGGWNTATILQFSSSATVAGQTVDVNAFRGTLNELRALTGARPDTPEDDMTPEQDALLRTIARLVGNSERIDTYETEGRETIPGLSYADGQVEPDKTSVPLVRLRETFEAVARLETDLATLRTELADLRASVAPPDPAAIAREIIAQMSGAPAV
jgi:hypothetical protein